MFKGKPTAVIEGDIASLEKRRSSLEARQAKAAAAVLNATGARRVMLTDLDDPDPAALDMADRAVREAEGARDGAADALREIESRITDAQGRLARLQAAEERERQAGAIEASAAAADKAIARIAKAAGEIDRARADLAAALLPEAVACYAPPVSTLDWGPRYLTLALAFDYQGRALLDTLSTDQVAARVAGHIVSTALPELGITRVEDTLKLGVDGQPTGILAPIADTDAARALLTDPMRAAAAKVRSAPEAA
jgi:hypothetical protein